MTNMATYARVCKVNFAAVNRAALPFLPSLLRSWLPDGRRHGGEYVALNPNRHDRFGSFSVNLRTGAWADFAIGDRGGDIVSLAAYLFRCNQVEAARLIAVVLGVEVS
jgi:hypothetical protein